MSILYVNDIIHEARVTIRAELEAHDINSENSIGALLRLNSILAGMNATQTELPYAVNVSFNITAGKNSYVIGTTSGADVNTTPFTIISFVNLIFDNVSYPVTIQDDFVFLEQVFIPTITGRPIICRLNKANGNTTIQFYPTPDRAYQCNIWGKKPVGAVSFQDYVDFPDYYAEFLILELAWKLNSRLNLMNWTPELEQQRLKAEQIVMKAAKRDLRIKSTPPFYHMDTFYSGRLGVIP